MDSGPRQTPPILSSQIHFSEVASVFSRDASSRGRTPGLPSRPPPAGLSKSGSKPSEPTQQPSLRAASARTSRLKAAAQTATSRLPSHGPIGAWLSASPSKPCARSQEKPAESSLQHNPQLPSPSPPSLTPRAFQPREQVTTPRHYRNPNVDTAPSPHLTAYAGRIFSPLSNQRGRSDLLIDGPDAFLAPRRPRSESGTWRSRTSPAIRPVTSPRDCSGEDYAAGSTSAAVEVRRPHTAASVGSGARTVEGQDESAGEVRAAETARAAGIGEGQGAVTEGESKELDEKEHKERIRQERPSVHAGTAKDDTGKDDGDEGKENGGQAINATADGDGKEALTGKVAVGKASRSPEGVGESEAKTPRDWLQRRLRTHEEAFRGFKKLPDTRIGVRADLVGAPWSDILGVDAAAVNQTSRSVLLWRRINAGYVDAGPVHSEYMNGHAHQTGQVYDEREWQFHRQLNDLTRWSRAMAFAKNLLKNNK